MMENEMIRIMQILGPIRRNELRDDGVNCDTLLVDDLTGPRFPTAVEFMRLALECGRHADLVSWGRSNAGTFRICLFCDPDEFPGVGEVQS